MKAEYHPKTIDDLNTAVAHYNHVQAGLGDSLRIEVYGAIDRILQNPEQYRVVENEIRRCFVHRFPYSVLYHIVSAELVHILVIRHHRQHPQFGLRRK